MLPDCEALAKLVDEPAEVRAAVGIVRGVGGVRLARAGNVGLERTKEARVKARQEVLERVAEVDALLLKLNNIEQ